MSQDPACDAILFVERRDESGRHVVDPYRAISLPDEDGDAALEDLLQVASGDVQDGAPPSVEKAPAQA